MAIRDNARTNGGMRVRQVVRDHMIHDIRTPRPPMIGWSEISNKSIWARGDKRRLLSVARIVRFASDLM